MFLVAHCILLLSALSAVQSACPGSPWKEWRGHCYRLTPRVTWHDFRAECKSPFRRADVVSIESRPEENYILREISGLRDIWLGMRSYGETEHLLWIDGTPITYTNFDTSRSTSEDSKTSKAVKMNRKGVWKLVSTYDPSIKLFGVCKMPSCSCPEGWQKWGNICHRAVPKRLGWVEARQHCKRLAPTADLATIRNSREQDFLHTLTGHYSTIWIGLNDREQEGVYRWSGDGRPPTGETGDAVFKNWRQGEPNGLQHREDCVAMKEDKTWVDRSCSAIVTGDAFICQQLMCGMDKVVEKEQTRIGPVRIWRPEDGVRCPVGWSRSGSKCFKQLPHWHTFAGAEKQCKTFLNGKIAVIDSLVDNDMAWLTTDQLSAWITTNWIEKYSKSSGEPVCLTLENGRWHQVPCDASRPALCEMPACDPKCPAGWSRFEGHCYRVVNTRRKPADAEAACKKAGGHLASIQTQDENDYIQTLAFPYRIIDELDKAKSARFVWIGASRINTDSAWSWNDCANWTMSRWVGTDELNPPSDHTCALMDMAGRWKGSALCGDQLRFRSVCKLDPCVKQFGPVDDSGCSGSLMWGSRLLQRYPIPS